MFRRLEFGAVRGFAPICVDSNDTFTVACGFYKRLLRDLPAFDPLRIEKLKLFVHEFVRANFDPVVATDFETWLQSESYDENRKKQLRQAHESLRGGPPTARQCSHIDTFVKSEAYSEFKHARMINSRSDAFKVWFGPWAKAMEEEVYKYPMFIKHVPVVDRPAAVRNIIAAGMNYYATDFTAFESHFIPEIMDAIEFELYRYLLPQPVSDLVIKTLGGTNKMRTRSGIRAECDGKRMSGDMITSLGNGFSNLMLVKFLCAEQGFDVSGFVEGDDGLFATRATLTKEAYQSLGFTIKMEKVSNPCAASFCGLIFGEDGQIIRDPRRFLMKFGWTQSFINAGPKIMNELLKAKALSCAYESPHCPIVGVIARVALDRTKQFQARYTDQHVRAPTDYVVPEFAPTLATRALFSEMYGISVELQLLCETLIREGRMEEFATIFSDALKSVPTKGDTGDLLNDSSLYFSNYVVPA